MSRLNEINGGCDQPRAFKCPRARCRTCPYICNVEKLSGPTRSIKIPDHFTYTSTNDIYCITCTLCKKLYIGETGRRLGDRFREHLRDEKDDKSASKPVARHFKLPNHSKQHMVVCGLSQHQGSTESRKTLEQKFIFQIGTLNPHGINTGNPNTLSAIKINVVTVIYLCPCVFFESLRRDLNEAKAVSCNVVNYLISPVNISHLPLCNYDAPVTSQVSSNVDVANYLLSSVETFSGFITAVDIGIVLFFASLWTSTSSRSINTQKKNLANIRPS